MTIRKDRAFTISFPVIDSSGRPSRLTGVSFVAGDTKISLDGAAFANTTNQPAEISSTGRYSLVLTAAEMNANHLHVMISKSTIDDIDLIYATGGQPSGLIVANGGNSSTTFKTNLTSATNDFWKDALCLFTGGTLAEQVKKVTAYDGTTKFLTVQGGFTGTPSASDSFVLINL